MLREYWLRILGISAWVVVPCFWHQNIEAGDLSSHTYNAWLAQLIQRGQAPGLWLARQSSNILLDLALVHLGNLVGLRAAEKITVACSALVFFWGAFVFISASMKRVPWFVAPCIAMFTYGWTFQQGLMNCYISLGLSFWALAIVRSRKGWKRAPAAALVPLIWMAHPVGLAFAIAAGTYLLVAGILSEGRQLLLAAAAGVLLLLVRVFLASHYPVTYAEEPTYFLNGVDQLILYGRRYEIPAILFLVVAAGCLARELLRGWRELVAAAFGPLQLYALSILAVALLPNVVNLPQYGAVVGGLSARMTTVSAVLICCLLGATRPRKWAMAGFSIAAVIFFFFLYRDTGTLNSMENQTEHYETLLPPGRRVIATIWPFPGSRIHDYHLVDRPCIGHCFSYGNYEPATEQFRVRAAPGNTIVAADPQTVAAMRFGAYVVQPQDLPMFQMFQCKLDMVGLCMRELAAGETNGKYGLHPVVQYPKNDWDSPY